jgi:hypothetical protein
MSPPRMRSKAVGGGGVLYWSLAWEGAVMMPLQYGAAMRGRYQGGEGAKERRRRILRRKEWRRRSEGGRRKLFGKASTTITAIYNLINVL